MNLSQRIESYLKLADEATENWVFDSYRTVRDSYDGDYVCKFPKNQGDTTTGIGYANAQFIIQSRNEAPDLIRTLQEQVSVMRRCLLNELGYSAGDNVEIKECLEAVKQLEEI